MTSHSVGYDDPVLATRGKEYWRVISIGSVRSNVDWDQLNIMILP